MLMASYNNGMRMLNVLPRVTERTRERVAREFDDLGPDVCMNSIMRDLQRHNPELLDMASKWANDVGAADRIITAFGMFYRLLSAETLSPLEPRAISPLPRVRRSGPGQCPICGMAQSTHAGEVYGDLVRSLRMRQSEQGDDD